MKALLTHTETAQPVAGPAWRKHPLTRKLAIVTVVKVVGLFLLWWAFFSGNGQGDITPDQAADAMLHPEANRTQINHTNDQQRKNLAIRRSKEKGR